MSRSFRQNVEPLIVAHTPRTACYNGVFVGKRERHVGCEIEGSVTAEEGRCVSDTAFNEAGRVMVILYTEEACQGC